MKEEEICPHCDKLVEFNVTEDYWETEQGEEIDVVKCPDCNGEVSISWESSVEFYFNKA